MDLLFLYDTARDLFAIGYNVSDQRRDGSFYDLLASEARLARWKERHEGRRPKSIRVGYSAAVRDHKLLNKLKAYEGILSDAFVHFTPESVVMQAFRETTEGTTDTIELPYLEMDQKVIEQQLILLAGIHASIIEIFDGPIVSI